MQWFYFSKITFSIHFWQGRIEKGRRIPARPVAICGQSFMPAL